MWIFVLWIVISTCDHIRSEKIFYQCTFDRTELCRLRSYDGGDEMMIESGYQFSSSSKPIQPWSDVSSILKPTEHGYQCQVPYQTVMNSNELYFCYQSSNSSKCRTSNGMEDVCQNGKYQVLPMFGNFPNRDFITPQINGSANGTCLTFYYYLTKGQTLLLYTYYLNDKGEEKLIAAFVDVPFNGWHLARESFKPGSTSYRIRFRIFRVVLLNPSEWFYVAFDQISVTEGMCGSTLPGDQNPIDSLPIGRRTFEFDNIVQSRELSRVEDTTDDSSDPPEYLSSTQIDSDTSESSVSNIQSTEGSSHSVNPSEVSTSTIPSGTDRSPSSDYTSIFNTTNVTITSIPTTERPPAQYSLATVLGLSIGLGIPAALGVVGALVYLFKRISSKKTKVVPIKTTHRHHHRSKKPKHHHRHRQQTNARRDETV